MPHRHKNKHHDSEQQAGPAQLNFCGNAQRRGQQRKADKIRPKQTPWHVRGHRQHDEFCDGEMLGAEDRQWDGETQVAQGYDLVQAACPRDIGLRSPHRNQEKQDAGAAHRNRRARDLKKYRENGCVHVNSKPKRPRSISGTFPGIKVCTYKPEAEKTVNTASNCTTKSRPHISCEAGRTPNLTPSLRYLALQAIRLRTCPADDWRPRCERFNQYLPSLPVFPELARTP